MKQVKNLLVYFLITYIFACTCISGVQAKDIIKIAKVSRYDENTAGHFRKTTTGLYAYCMHLGIPGPVKGDILYFDKLYDDGKYIYIFNNSGGNTEKEIIIRQHAIWICQGKTLSSSKYKYVKEAKKLCTAGEKAGSKYQPKPTIKTVESITMNYDSSSNYYVSKAISVKRDRYTKKYYVKLSGAPEGTKVYTSGGKNITSSSGNIIKTTAAKIVIKTPKDSVNNDTPEFTINFTGTASYYEVKKYEVKNKNKQSMAVPHKKNVKPKASATVQYNPVRTMKIECSSNNGEDISVKDVSKIKSYNNLGNVSVTYDNEEGPIISFDVTYIPKANKSGEDYVEVGSGLVESNSNNMPNDEILQSHTINIKK